MLTRGVRISSALASLAVVALLGAGCTGGSGGHSGGSGGSVSSDRTSAAPGQIQINPVAYAKVKNGGVLNYPIISPIANFNSYQLNGSNVDTDAIVRVMLPSLFTIDGADDFLYNPDYLTGEPKVAMSPAQTMTYELNPKAKWSDGAPISYRDFVSQWQALNGSNPDFAITSPAGYRDIASVARGATDREVIVALRAGIVDADWRGLFSPLYPMPATETPAAFNAGWRTKPLLSAGPFEYRSAAAGTYTFTRNPSWWGRTPKLNSIVFRVLPSLDATAAALSSHQIDLQNIGQDPTTYGRVKAVPGISMRAAGGPNYRAITINGARLSSIKVRQALAMGIDRNAIAAAELGPLGIANAAAPDDHIFQANQTGYHDNAGPLGTYNPTAAGQLLDAAGWADSATTHVRTKNGKPLEISFVIPANTALSASEARLVQQQLAKIDVLVNIKPVNGTEFFNGYVKPGKYDFAVFSWLGDSFPISSASSIYEPEQPGHDWQQNYSRVSVPQIDALFKQAEANLDQAAANAVANQADALIWENVLSVPIYQRPDVWAVNSKLANFGAFGFATVDWTDVGFTS